MPSLSAALLVLSTSAFADDALKTALTADDVSALIAAKGHKFEVQRDSEGDPLILAVNPLIGHRYQVLFYNCRADGLCEGIQLRAWFTHTEPISTEQMNAWNSEQAFGRAFVDTDGDPNIDTFVYAHKGVTTAYVAGELNYFLKVMRDFHDALAGSIE